MRIFRGFYFRPLRAGVQPFLRIFRLFWHISVQVMKESGERRDQRKQYEEIRRQFNREKKIKRQQRSGSVNQEERIEGLKEPIGQSQNKGEQSHDHRVFVESLPLGQRLLIKIIPFIEGNHRAGESHQKIEENEAGSVGKRERHKKR